MSRAKVFFAFTPQAELELGIAPSALHRRLNELVELESKRDSAMKLWLATPKNTPASADTYSVLESLETQISGVASTIAYLWRQDNL